MSISEQVKELRMYADEYEQPPYGRAVEKTENVLRNAADIIETLSAKLQVADTERSSAYYENDTFAKIITALDERIGAEWRIIAGLNDETQIYGCTRSLEAYQQSKLIVKQNIEEYKEKQSEMDYGGGWISCEDRLPKIGQIVIVYQSFREIHGNPGTSTSIGQYLGSDDDNVPNWRFISYRANIHERLVSAYMVDNWQIIGNNEYVIAWQPLPEPYCPQS